MIRVILIAAGCLLAAFGLLSYFDPGVNGLYCLYETKFQTPLFTGFLTIGGFLLTLKTFVLVQLKKELYESEYYKAQLNNKRLANPNLSLYGPLNRLGSLLVFCVLAALTTAVLQFSVGFIHNKFAAAFCIGFAAGALALVFQAWYEIKQNLTNWFEYLDDKDKQEQESIKSSSK